MKTLKAISAFLLLYIIITSCEKVNSLDTSEFMDYSTDKFLEKFSEKGNVPKATGSVEFTWNGGGNGGAMGKKPENLRAFFSFNAHVGNALKDPKGEIVYLVTYPDLTQHREIRAKVTGVKIVGKFAWFVGVVTSDTKGCAGDGNGGHAPGCSSSDEGGGGGCAEEIDGHDGGCSSGGTDEGGCSSGGTDEGGCSSGGTNEGGCSDGGTDEGGCSGGGMGEEGGGSGSTGGSMGNPLSGKNCRLGQIIAVKVHDVDTPGINDGLTWKWFSPTAAFVPGVDNIANWPHLCKKTIIDGNLKVH